MKKRIGVVKVIAISAFCLAQVVWAQQKGTFTDERDGKKYKTVKIGEQTWMAENLNYEVEGSKCYGEDGSICLGYDDEHDQCFDARPFTKNEIQIGCKKYGRKYNWQMALEACPSGWHLPNDDEWQVLVDFAGGDKIAGKKLKAKNGWNNKGNGTDNFGFTALPSGRDANGHVYFVGNNNYGDWWSAKDYSTGAHYWRMSSYAAELYKGSSDKATLRSIRCLQGSAEAAAEAAKSKAIAANEARLAPLKDSFTDERDEKKYKTIKIGEQTWMAENLNYNAEGSKCYDNAQANCDKYGRLYDWDAAKTICPKGWHLPSKEEWNTLASYCGAMHLKATYGWDDDGNGKDAYGFTALPGGNGYSNGSFYMAGGRGLWWSTAEYNASLAYIWYMYYRTEKATLINSNKSDLLSVRCLQNDGNEATLSLDEEKKTVKTENLDEKKNPQAIGADMENDAVKKWKTLSNQNGCRTSTASKNNDCHTILGSLAKELLKLESEKKIDHNASLPVILDYIKYFPNGPAAPNMLFQASFILESKNEHVQALELRQQLVTKYPNHTFASGAWLRIGEYYYKNSNWIEAIKSYERVINNATISKKESTYAIYHMAESYYNMGNCRIATQKFQEYIDGAAKNKYISDLRNEAMGFIAKCK